MISLNFNIRYSTQQHKDILGAIRARVRQSDKATASRHQAWADAEESQQTYIKETDLDAIRRANKRDAGVLDYQTVVVPYSYGMMMAAHTYWTSVFLSRTPIAQFTARHGEPQQSVLAIEALMDYQIRTGGHLLPYYIWLFDAAKYGVGILGHYWDEETSVISNIVEKDETLLGMPTGRKKKVREVQRVKGYQGTRVFNVKPTDFIFDPRVPLSQLQSGEFCGRRIKDFSLNDLRAGAEDGDYFNVEVVERMGPGGYNFHHEKGSSQVEWPEPNDSVDPAGKLHDPGFIALEELCIRLIPKDWKLGESSYPEKWVFTVANEKVIIGARPLGEYHDRFPFDIIEQEIEGYSLFKRGLMEQYEDLNNIVSWLFNSHFFNVRAALNNQFIYDPSMISPRSMADPQPGMRVRVRPEAYGRDVRTMVSQLPVADVTRSHFNDLDNVGQMMQRASGVVDNIMGMVNDGGRKTATEVRTSSSFGINRLKTQAEYMSAMGWQPMMQKLLQTSQQHYDMERKFRVVGDLPMGKEFIQVTPEEIAGFYDWVPVDGTLPIDRFAQANLWKELLAGAQKMPQVASQFDLAGIFQWVAQLSGMRSINQFRIQTMDNAAVQGQAQAGNLVPMSELNNMNEPGQIPGMGPTG